LILRLQICKGRVHRICAISDHRRAAEALSALGMKSCLWISGLLCFGFALRHYRALRL
jgi:hypothetical protein